MNKLISFSLSLVGIAACYSNPVVSFACDGDKECGAGVKCDSAKAPAKDAGKSGNASAAADGKDANQAGKAPGAVGGAGSQDASGKAPAEK